MEINFCLVYFEQHGDGKNPGPVEGTSRLWSSSDIAVPWEIGQPCCASESNGNMINPGGIGVR